MKPLLKKRVYCHRNTTLFIEFFVWKDKKQLQKQHEEKLGKGSIGFHTPYRILNFNKGKQTTSPLIGEVHLCGEFGIEAVVHELQHACMNWCRERKINPLEQRSEDGFLAIDSGEERACYSIGYMARQVVTALNKNKIWP